jgi:hypothetical protein
VVRAARFGRLTLVAAEEDVMLEVAHLDHDRTNRQL